MWIALLAALATAAPGDRFVPPVKRVGDLAVVPLVFTDGTRARLTYPARLRLAELGVKPYGSGTLRGGDDRDFAIRHAQVDDVTAGWTRLAEYADARGQPVGYWDSGDRSYDPNFLAFQFGPWTLLVWDFPPGYDGGDPPMPDVDRAAWARSLHGNETRSGFLRLRGSGRLRLTRSGEHAGPQLAFGGRLTLSSGNCRRTRHHDRRMFGRWVSWNRRNANWCVSRTMRADAGGSATDMRALIRGVRVRR